MSVLLFTKAFYQSAHNVSFSAFYFFFLVAPSQPIHLTDIRLLCMRVPGCVSHLAQGAHQLRRVLRVVESRGSQSFRKVRCHIHTHAHSYKHIQAAVVCTGSCKDVIIMILLLELL